MLRLLSRALLWVALWWDRRRFPPRACRACRRTLPAETWGAALRTHPGGPGARGDVTVCPSCGATLVFWEPDRVRRFDWRRDPRVYGTGVVAQIRRRQRELAERNSGARASAGERCRSVREHRNLVLSLR